MDAVHPKNPLQPADQRPPRDAPRGRRGIPTRSAAPTPANRRHPNTGPPHSRANSPPPHSGNDTPQPHTATHHPRAPHPGHNTPKQPRPTDPRTPQTQYPTPPGPPNGGPTPLSTTRPHPPGCNTPVPHTPPQGTPGPTPHRPRTGHVLKHTRRTIKRPRGAAPHRQRTNHRRQPTPPDLDTVPPPPNGKATTQHNTTIPHRTPLPHPRARDTTAHQHRNEATPRRLRTPPHRHHPWKPRTPRASSTPTSGHNPNRTQGQHHRPGQPPACSHTPQPRQTARLPRRTTPHRPPHVPRTPASHAHRAMKQHPST